MTRWSKKPQPFILTLAIASLLMARTLLPNFDALTLLLGQRDHLLATRLLLSFGSLTCCSRSASLTISSSVRQSATATPTSPSNRQDFYDRRHRKTFHSSCQYYYYIIPSYNNQNNYVICWLFLASIPVARIVTLLVADTVSAADPQS